MIIPSQIIRFLPNYQEVSAKINNSPIAVLFKKVLDFQCQLENKISNKNQELMSTVTSWKTYSGKVGPWLLAFGITVCLTSAGNLFYSGISAIGLGCGGIIMREQQLNKISSLKCDIDELKKENYYITAMLDLLLEFDKIENSRENLIKKINFWYHCQDTSISPTVEEIFMVLQEYLASDNSLKRNLTLAINLESSEQVKEIAWNNLEIEMGCRLSLTKVHQAYAHKHPKSNWAEFNIGSH